MAFSEYTALLTETLASLDNAASASILVASSAPSQSEQDALVREVS